MTHVDTKGRLDQSLPMSAWRGFREGLAVPWAGLQYMSRYPGLWRYGVWPVLLNLLITGLLLMLLIGGGVYSFAAVRSRLGDGWLWLPVELLVAALLIVVLVGLTVVAWMVLQSVLCGWFYDKLARHVEGQLGAPPEELKDVPLWPQVVDSLKDAAQLLLINVVCLAVQIIPGFGAILGLCGSYYFTCNALGLEYLDYPLSLRGLRRPEKRAFARRHRLQTLGFGTSVVLLAIVPVFNAVFLTTAVTGAVLLHQRLCRE